MGLNERELDTRKSGLDAYNPLGDSMKELEQDPNPTFDYSFGRRDNLKF